MESTKFKAGDRVRFKSKENIKGISSWFEGMREDLPKEFTITSVVSYDENYDRIYGHDTNYYISNSMLELVSSPDYIAGSMVYTTPLYDNFKTPPQKVELRGETHIYPEYEYSNGINVQPIQAQKFDIPDYMKTYKDSGCSPVPQFPSKEWFDEKYPKNKRVKRITFSKIQ